MCIQLKRLKSYPARLGGFAEFGQSATFWSLRSAGYQHVKCVICFISRFYPWVLFLPMCKCSLFTNPWNSCAPVPPSLMLLSGFQSLWPGIGTDDEGLFLAGAGAEIQPEHRMRRIVLILLGWESNHVVSWIEHKILILLQPWDFFYLPSCLSSMVVFEPCLFVCFLQEGYVLSNCHVWHIGLLRTKSKISVLFKQYSLKVGLHVGIRILPWS